MESYRNTVMPNLAVSWDRMMRYKINDKIHELLSNILGVATHA